MRAPVLLNIDLGELPDEPEVLYASAHVANIACGGHAGDDGSISRAVQRCRAHGVKVGAHPSYPDREGFGRRQMDLSLSALRDTVAEQCARIREIARSLGEAVGYVKAHGALYHAANGAPALAEALIEGAAEALGREAVVVGPARGALALAAAGRNLRFAREAFADRETLPDGSLVPRDRPNALLLDPARAAARAISLASGDSVDTICVHGDTPGAVAIARAVRSALDSMASR